MREHPESTGQVGSEPEGELNLAMAHSATIRVTAAFRCWKRMKFGG